MPFANLLGDVWRRYGRPIVVAETGHVGASRSDWLQEIATQVEAAVQAGVPVQGICLYPIIDRPDWDDHDDWHRCRLWDASADKLDADSVASTTPVGDGAGRHLHQPLADVLRNCQQPR